MSEDVKVIVVAVGCAIALMLSFGAIAVALGLIADHQRYSAYLEAQRTVLQCRADHITAPDRICGPIPTLESIK